MATIDQLRLEYDIAAERERTAANLLTELTIARAKAEMALEEALGHPKQAAWLKAFIASDYDECARLLPLLEKR